MHGKTRKWARQGALLAGALSLAACAAPSRVASTSRQAIEVQSVRLTAAGHYVDLRYRVLDADRANQALGPKVRPKLISEATGAVMAVPTTAKLGSLRQTQAVQATGRNYFVMFVNNGLTPGSRVTAELGEIKFQHLLVQ
jgi:hypothetical protein